MSEETTGGGRETFPCHNCGAPLAYKPGATTLVCPFCGAENEIPSDADPDAPPLEELDLEEALRGQLDNAEVEEVTTVKCPNCGAEIGMDAGTLADVCPFCATPLAKEAAHSHRHPKPQGVLPFAFDERTAKQKMKDWLGSLWFAPSKLKQFAEAGRPLSGVYLPHYTYDAIGDADYRGQRGDAYYVTRTRTVMVDGKPQQQTYQERRVNWTPVSGHVRHRFDDVLVPASNTMGDKAARAEYGGRSWDLAAMEGYRSEYLAGFRAEAPSLSLEEGFQRAHVVMENTLRGDVRRDIGGDEQRISAMKTDYSELTFKHVLLPVWLASYRWNNTAYQVIVNGRTGEVSGERPYSAIKIAIAVILALIVAGVVAYFMSQR